MYERMAVVVERCDDAEKWGQITVERLKKKSRFPAVLSSHTTSMLPLESATICALNEKPELLDTFFGVEKVAPPSVERVKKMWGLGPGGGVSAHTTLTLPPASTTIRGCA